MARKKKIQNNEVFGEGYNWWQDVIPRHEIEKYTKPYSDGNGKPTDDDMSTRSGETGKQTRNNISARSGGEIAEPGFGGIDIRTFNNYRNSVVRTLKGLKPLTNVEGDYTNPTEDQNYGTIDLQSVGHIKQIQINYDGNIQLHEDYELNNNFCIYINYKSRFILMTPKKRIELNSQQLLKYKGFIFLINRFAVYGYHNTRKIFNVIPRKEFWEYKDSIWEHDKTICDDNGIILPNDGVDNANRKFTRSVEGVKQNFKLPYRTVMRQHDANNYIHEKNKFTDNIDDAAYETYDIKKNSNLNLRLGSRSHFTNFKSRLPDNYGYATKKNIFCLNCRYLNNNNICKLWRAPVKTNYVCNSYINSRDNKRKI